MVLLVLSYEDEQPQRGLLYFLTLLQCCSAAVLISGSSGSYILLLRTRLGLRKGLQGRSSLLMALDKSRARSEQVFQPENVGNAFKPGNHITVGYHIRLLQNSAPKIAGSCRSRLVLLCIHDHQHWTTSTVDRRSQSAGDYSIRMLQAACYMHLSCMRHAT